MSRVSSCDTVVERTEVAKPDSRNAGMTEFKDAIRIFQALPNGEHLAAELFRKSFAAPFPVPRDNCGLRIATPPENWHQYVAVYAWPEGAEETIGFCNWIRFGEVYLEGGMCVQKDFYRRLPANHFQECRLKGGIAQMMMEDAASKLNDCAAWFGYCGDGKALAVNLRVGYELTRHKHLIVKWFRPLPPDARSRLIDSIAAIGPF